MSQRHLVTEFRCNSTMTNGPQEKLADRLHRRMKDLHVKPTDLSARSKIAYSTLAGILSGAQPTVTHERLYALAKALQVSMEWLAVGGELASKPDDLQFLLTDDELTILNAVRANKKILEKMLTVVEALTEETAGSHPSKRAKDRRVTAPARPA